MKTLVLNTLTGAVSEYDNFEFDAITATHAGSATGLYALGGDLDDTAPFPERELVTPRGRQGAPRKKVVLPEGWLDDTDGRGAHLREDADETTGG